MYFYFLSLFERQPNDCLADSEGDVPYAPRSITGQGDTEMDNPFYVSSFCIGKGSVSECYTGMDFLVADLGCGNSL